MSRNSAKYRARASDTIAADRLPSCVCGDLSDPDTQRCDCGRLLFPLPAALHAMNKRSRRDRAVQHATRRTL